MSLKKCRYSTQGQRKMYCHYCEKTFVILEHVITTPREALLVLMIEQGEALADIGKSLLLNSTGLSRGLLKLAREANYKESRQCFPASDTTLSTRAFRVRYNGSSDSLYALVTAEEQGDRMVAISANYSPSVVEQHHQYTPNYKEHMSPGTLAYHAQHKELSTMRRGTLFDIDYDPAALHQNDPGVLVKPTLPTYRYFELVRILTDERSDSVQHYLGHECFILGDCPMANLQHIHQDRCRISFVKERGVAPATIDLPP